MPDAKQQTTATVEVSTKELDAMADKAMVQGGGLMTALFTVVGGIMWFRKRFAHDNLEVKRDQSEGKILDIVMAERNQLAIDAREAWARTRTDAELIGKLTAQVDAMEKLNHKTNNEVYLLRLLNEKQAKEMEALRQEFTSVKDQLKTCASCPLRSIA